MNYRLRLLATLLSEIGEQLSLSNTRDIKYIMSRCEHEGDSFLTITLPTFCDGFDRSLEEGRASPSFFPAYARQKQGCLPKFLSGFTKLVFASTGELLSDPCKDAIYAVRQITRFFKKASIPCSDTRVLEAINKYAETDKGLAEYDEHILSTEHNTLDEIASLIVDTTFKDFHLRNIKCGHGPGATSEKLKRNERINISEWPTRSEPYFPSSWHCVPNIGHIDQLRKVRFLLPSQERPVRVVTVPKTLKTPRIIAVEPSHMQFMQQGLLRYIVPTVERSYLMGKSVHFTDQSINRESARLSSISGKNATIDLSEASDRVSLALVMRLFRSKPLLLNAILACRSRKAVLPGGELITLNKFASMGSALCFPIEAICFYILLQYAEHLRTGKPVSRDSVRLNSFRIHVYGDDIIIPVDWLNSSVATLEAFGLKVNASKSFSKSKFRESCGGDYYDGYWVKPCYLRINPAHLDSRCSDSELVSITDLSNQLYLQGLWKTCQMLRDYVVTQTRVDIPYRSYDTGGLFFKSGINSYNRWNKNTQRLESRTLVVKTSKVKDELLNYSSYVTKALSNIGNDFCFDALYSVRPHTLRLKCGWVQ